MYLPFQRAFLFLNFPVGVLTVKYFKVINLMVSFQLGLSPIRYVAYKILFFICLRENKHFYNRLEKTCLKKVVGLFFWQPRMKRFFVAQFIWSCAIIRLYRCGKNVQAQSSTHARLKYIWIVLRDITLMNNEKSMTLNGYLRRKRFLTSTIEIVPPILHNVCAKRS